ncbi:NAD(P)-dependent oxidoreductase [Planotetraspora thailandica]|uniref:dTDP-4-dehydrorhamnose reductase n=1 Tax=Planotetraspora thailandica TaxID=487172 RepID=A0A8J3UYF6_9ACTN|nr:dTDP-4-dehydrorhamnose reductase [Planotetraspora thailandica]GII53543.1 NAD(P)-dependent oxidoreductase [Planotetraspora thailandica]
MTRWLITGAGGMLGTDLVAVLRAGRHEVVPLERSRLDLRDASAIQRVVHEVRPGVVVNCAAWTAVDEAETREDEALAVNGGAVQALAEACLHVGARLVQPSTDYVFGGDAGEPYAEDAPTMPLNAYGRTKLAGEQAVVKTLPETGYVVRTAWLYGTAGPSFVKTMARLAGERETVDVVDDQHGQPTWTVDLAEQIVALAGSGAPPGIYHGTSSGSTTWHGLAREVFSLLGADPDRVRPVGSAAYRRPAPRPAYSVLGHRRWAEAGIAPIRHWRDALHAAWPSMAAGGA